jgi:hypothetical protein
LESAPHNDNAADFVAFADQVIDEDDARESSAFIWLLLSYDSQHVNCFKTPTRQLMISLLGFGLNGNGTQLCKTCKMLDVSWKIMLL